MRSVQTGMRPITITRRSAALYGAALFAAATGATACGMAAADSTHSPPAVVGIVQGKMFQAGGPAGPHDLQLVSGDVTLTNVATGAQYSVHATTKGYSIGVPAGTYRVTGLSSDDFSDGHRMSASAIPNVVVHTGRTSFANLYVQVS